MSGLEAGQENPYFRAQDFLKGEISCGDGKTTILDVWSNNRVFRVGKALWKCGAMKEITSRANPLLKYAHPSTGATPGTGREVPGGGCALLEDAVGAGLGSRLFLRRLLAGERDSNCYRNARTGAVSAAGSPRQCWPPGRDRLSQGIIAVVKYPLGDRAALLAEPGLLLVVTDPYTPVIWALCCGRRRPPAAGGNFSPGTVDPFNSKVLRASMGAVFRLPLLTEVSFFALLGELKEKGYHLVAADVRGSIPYWEADYSLPGALVVGNEAWGVNDKVLARVEERVRIPLKEGVDSLNAAVAAGIILYEWVRQGGLIPKKDGTG